MKCPNCNETLIAVERNKIEVEYCPNCGGFWLDADEWYLIMQALGIKNRAEDIMSINSYIKATDKEKMKKCPVCETDMEKIGTKNLILDRCPNYHGIWFDKGELSNYINAGDEIDENNAISFLGENFNR